MEKLKKINFTGANVDGAIELTKSTAYTTIIDSTTGTITTNEMVDGSEGSIFIYRIFATN